MAESAWGWLGKTATAVKQASEKVQQSVEALPTPPLADMNMNIGKALGKIMSSGDATGDAAAAPDDYLPWAVPRGWAQRSEAWVALSKGMVEQEAYVALFLDGGVLFVRGGGGKGAICLCSVAVSPVTPPHRFV